MSKEGDKSNMKIADKIVRLNETSSTNTTIKLLQQQNALPDGAVVMTDYQTKGRGQAGNFWYSSKGCNLLLSILLYPYEVKAKNQFIISRIVSLAIKRVLDKYVEGITIKWPNDIYWNSKKIAGILIENSLSGQHIDYTIVGIGLNVNEAIFPKDLPNPISMKQIIGANIDREQLFGELYTELIMLYKAIKRGETDVIEREYMHSLYRKNGVFWFSDKNGRFQAEIKDVLASGHIVLREYNTAEERVYAFKEVSYEED